MASLPDRSEDARRKLQRRVRSLARFGLTVEQYDLMLKRQGGKCICCGRPPKRLRLAVEHDHKTGRVRGLACHQCNRHIIGRNTAATAEWLFIYLSSTFDGRKL